ncbi:hypothetical protein PFICI_03108 [Pestalotiopsis fici W106-1]|uniref:Uncharacterized protein n=1 Tax=Pestalotiopsis fici (strain W106-1 / CGMCC3.15140) TaxID=1229662 RepID=W3XG59_PESFW|nr:uncharacterized protein PFICI_03108 [Pestalotiopsis fici W106-1]ETS85083.1 hypothetical protein PFICI_03108 [Pestalotiopsis fici W106-1]
MQPAKDDAGSADPDATRNKPFRKEAANVIVAFEAHAGGGNSDEGNETDREKMRMSFKTCYDPPVVTFRFNVTVFGHGSGKKKQKTTLYFEVPRHHIYSLEQTHHVDMTTVPEMDQDIIPKLLGGITRVRFQLNHPGNLIQPIEDLSLKPASQRTLQTMTLLATVLEFVVFMPHTTLSKEQFQYLEQAITSPISFDDQQQQEKEQEWWLRALYGGAGGKVLNACTATVDSQAIQRKDTSTASESGDSTVAAATPPAYKRSDKPVEGLPAPSKTNDWITESDASDLVVTASPPPYQASEGKASTAADSPRKRLRDSAKLDAKSSRRRLDGQRLSTADAEAYSERLAGDLRVEKNEEVNLNMSYPVAMFLSKFNEVLRRTQDLEDENSALKDELCAMRKTQDQISAELKEMKARNQSQVERIQGLENKNVDLETQVAGLEQCHDAIEERQLELEERQGKAEDKCDNIEMEIIDQVHTALRNRLIDALETM